MTVVRPARRKIPAFRGIMGLSQAVAIRDSLFLSFSPRIARRASNGGQLCAV